MYIQPIVVGGLSPVVTSKRIIPSVFLRGRSDPVADPRGLSGENPVECSTFAVAKSYSEICHVHRNATRVFYNCQYGQNMPKSQNYRVGNRNGYGSIPISTIFSGLFTSILTQLQYFGVHGTVPGCHDPSPVWWPSQCQDSPAPALGIGGVEERMFAG
jgi:hypothetical protein